MKQGEAKHVMGGGKTEPVSRAVNPAAVAELGIQEVRHKSLPLYEGRGLEAPKASCTIHHAGTQGKR